MAEDHLRGAVEAGLDVRVDGAPLEAGAAVVHELHLARVEGLEEDVLGLDVAVDDGGAAEDAEGAEDLGEEEGDSEGRGSSPIHDRTALSDTTERAQRRRRGSRGKRSALAVRGKGEIAAAQLGGAPG